MSNAKNNHRLEGRTLYIPRMPYSGARVIAATFESIGISAYPTPPSNQRTKELGGKYTSGDECYPEKVTMGNFMRLVEQDGFDPKKTAFLMPTADGPCRFGQYAVYQRKILDDNGFQDVMIVSPTSANSYEDIGEHSEEFLRTGWRGMVSSDILMKMLLKTRPYEINKGETDRVFEETLDLVCGVIAEQGVRPKDKLANMCQALTRARDAFRAIPALYNSERPLIGVVGEIFCRLNTFSNEDLVRKIEAEGGECWLSDVSEWLWYTNNEQQQHIREKGKRHSMEMLSAKIKNAVQRKDEHALLHPFREDFLGYEEPHGVREVLDLSYPYLPHTGVLGEMVLSVGKAIYLYGKGADGIVDISPFTCMNGIVCEAVYPVVSRDHDHIPIRTFYFDGSQSDLERDVGIFLELTKAYKRRKRTRRIYPGKFDEKARAA
ncbi:MAG: hypothetical protein V1800_18250 [Candidatus Latescibacterota bacterium]